MRENCVKSIWKRGGAAVNGWMGIPSSVAAEGMAQADCDSECPTRALCLHDADYVKGANDTIPMREGNVTGAQSTGKSAGGSMY